MSYKPLADFKIRELTAHDIASLDHIPMEVTEDRSGCHVDKLYWKERNGILYIFDHTSEPITV